MIFNCRVGGSLGYVLHFPPHPTIKKTILEAVFFVFFLEKTPFPPGPMPGGVEPLPRKRKKPPSALMFLESTHFCEASRISRIPRLRYPFRSIPAWARPRRGRALAAQAKKTSERPYVFRVDLFLRSLKDLKDPTSALPFLYVARGCPDRSQCGFKMIEYVSRPSTTQCSVFNAQHACSTQFSIQFSISSSQC